MGNKGWEELRDLSTVIYMYRVTDFRGRHIHYAYASIEKGANLKVQKPQLKRIGRWKSDLS